MMTTRNEATLCTFMNNCFLLILFSFSFIHIRIEFTLFRSYVLYISFILYHVCGACEHFVVFHSLFCVCLCGVSIYTTKYSVSCERQCSRWGKSYSSIFHLLSSCFCFTQLPVTFFHCCFSFSPFSALNLISFSVACSSLQQRRNMWAYANIVTIYSRSTRESYIWGVIKFSEWQWHEIKLCDILMRLRMITQKVTFVHTHTECTHDLVSAIWIEKFIISFICFVFRSFN